MTTTQVERPPCSRAEAVGDLEGIGRWRLYEQDGVTAVLYEWDVATTKPWMNRWRRCCARSSSGTTTG